MNKGTITIELPILDDVDQMEVVNTFNEKQLWYVCAIAKAFEKSQQELQRKDNNWNELKEWLIEKKENYNLELTFSYSLPIKNIYRQVLDKIKELEESK